MTAPGHPPAAEVRRLLDGELAPAAKDALMTHLESCPACLEVAEGLSAEESLLSPEPVPLDAATSRHQVEWHWVRGHSGHPENELADALANRGIRELRKRA